MAKGCYICNPKSKHVMPIPCLACRIKKEKENEI